MHRQPGDALHSAPSPSSCSASPETSGRMFTPQYPSTSTVPRPCPQHAPNPHTSSWSAAAWLMLLTVMLLLAPCTARPPQRSLNGNGSGGGSRQPSVASTLQKNNLNKVLDLLQKAGILSDPSWTGTLFAPIDKAFNDLVSQQQVNTNQLSPDLLKLVINYHILSAPLNQGDLRHGMELVTLAGQSLFVDRRTFSQVVTIRGFSSTAAVIRSLKVRDGVVVHIIDSALYPNTGAVVGCPSVMDVIQKSLLSQDFYNLIVYAGMADQLNSLAFSGTVLVPSNTALTLSKTLKVSQAQAMVSAYIIPSGVWTQTLVYHGMPLTTRSGSTYLVQQPGSGSGQKRYGLKKGQRVIALGGAHLACQAILYPIDGLLS